MKTAIKTFLSRFMKIEFLSAAAMILFAVTFSSCNNPRNEDPKSVAEEHNEAKFDNANEDDAKFLVNAAEINLEEIQLGQLAQTQGTTAHVKELGKMMETEHTQALGDLKALAAKKQITIPTSLTDDGMSAKKKLMDTKASDFDKDYSNMMVDGHKDAISKFEKAANDSHDSEIRSWATSMLPALRTHLDHAITCQKECERR